MSIKNIRNGRAGIRAILLRALAAGPVGEGDLLIIGAASSRLDSDSGRRRVRRVLRMMLEAGEVNASVRAFGDEPVWRLANAGPRQGVGMVNRPTCRDCRRRPAATEYSWYCLACRPRHKRGRRSVAEAMRESDERFLRERTSRGLGYDPGPARRGSPVPWEGET